MFNLKSKS